MIYISRDVDVGWKMKNISFKTKIKLFRSQLNWTQEDLAQQVGVSRETISYLEKGKYNPSLKLAYNIAKALETSIDNLFEFSEGE